MTRRVLQIAATATVHLAATTITWGLVFSRGMNQVPRTFWDPVLDAVLPILEFPVGVFQPAPSFPLRVLNSLIWGAVLVNVAVYAARHLKPSAGAA